MKNKPTINIEVEYLLGALMFGLVVVLGLIIISYQAGRQSAEKLIINNNVAEKQCNYVASKLPLKVERNEIVNNQGDVYCEIALVRPEDYTHDKYGMLIISMHLEELENVSRLYEGLDYYRSLGLFDSKLTVDDLKRGLEAARKYK